MLTSFVLDNCLIRISITNDYPSSHDVRTPIVHYNTNCRGPLSASRVPGLGTVPEASRTQSRATSSSTTLEL